MIPKVMFLKLDIKYPNERAFRIHEINKNMSIPYRLFKVAKIAENSIET